MQHLQDFPDLSASFAKLKLQQLIGANTHDSVFACICRDQVYSQPREVFQMVKEQIRDNRLLVIDMLGETIVVMIEKMEI